MAAAVAVASPLGARFERSVLRGIYPGRANEVDRCLNLEPSIAITGNYAPRCHAARIKDGPAGEG